MHNPQREAHPFEGPPRIEAGDLNTLRISLRAEDVTPTLDIPHYEYTPDSRSGIITAIALATAAGEAPSLELQAVEARVRRHASLYAQQDMDPTGYLPLDWGDEPIRLGMRYMIDERNKIVSANMFYDGPSRDREREVEAMLVPALAQQLCRLNGYMVRVTFAREHEEARRHTFDPSDFVIDR